METLEKQMEEIAGAWNGDEAGIQEEKTHIAIEILSHIESIKKLQDELNSI